MPLQVLTFLIIIPEVFELEVQGCSLLVKIFFFQMSCENISGDAPYTQCLKGNPFAI